MSYEGRVQVIDNKGHFRTYDDSGGNRYLDYNPQDAWYNSINDTNCDEVGEIPIEILNTFYLIQEAKYQVCNLGHNHIIKEAVYRIPGKESIHLRHHQIYCSDNTLLRVPIYPEEFKDLYKRQQAGEIFGTVP